jgi:hypothetical protein
MKRTAEFTLGLIGGILGILFSILVIAVGVVGESIDLPIIINFSTITFLGVLSLVVSIVAIVGAVWVKSKAKAGGWTMVICGIVGFIAVDLFYVISAILLLIGGLMAIFRKDKSA